MPNESDRIATAVVKTRPRISFVWIVPIVAAIIGAFLTFQAISQRGPTITITFAEASGLEAGKTRIRYKDVEVGKVETIDLAEDLSHVRVKARLVAGSERFLKENTRFWVERARVSAGAVTGLETLLSGEFIGIDPSTDEGDTVYEFVGLETPPPFTSDVPGTTFQLVADTLGALDVGAPVYFRWLEVGRLTHYELDASGDSVAMEVFIRSPHDQRVRANTLFWNASGFDASLTTEGFEIDSVSLTTLLIGGISFETPRDTDATSPGPHQVFPLYANKRATRKPSITVRRPFLLHFDQSIAGLAVGSPVEFRGVQLGEVTDIRMTYSAAGVPRVPVQIAMEPQRTGFGVDEDDDAFRQRWNSLVAQGLRAKLKTHNLITGQLAVSLDLEPDADPGSIDWALAVPEFPTHAGGFDQLLAGLTEFTGKLNSLPLDKIGNDMRTTIANLNAVLGDLQRASPALAGMLENAEETLQSANALVAPESPVATDLKRTLRELSAAARSLRLLAEQLEEEPESLLRGKESGQ